jgi:predicted phage terminase large subunit-like protein
MLDIDDLIDYALSDERVEVAPSVSFLEYKRRFWKGYIHTPYHALIDTYLMQLADYIFTGGQRGIKNLMLNMPPRHGKSETTQKFIGWVLGNDPDTPVITASYGASLATRNSRGVRRMIEDPQYQRCFPGVQLAGDSAAVNNWNLEGRKGGMFAVGVGGGVAGWGSKLNIVDDVVRSRATAESATYRQRTIEWWQNDIITRLEEPGGANLIINTRWQLNDLSGWLLDNEGDDWTVITLPALARENDPLGRQPGEALWDRYPADWLNKQRERMGEYAFSALYQQAPLPPGGGLFDTANIEIVDHAPEVRKVVRFYDLAVTASKHSDYTAGAKLGLLHDNRIIILDMFRAQKTMPEIQEAIVQNAQVDGESVFIRLEAEKAGIVQLDYLLRDPRMMRYAMDKKQPIGDKYTRATPFATRVNNKQVLMLRGVWNRACLDEMAVFPQGEHDDQIDALSGAYDLVTLVGIRPEPELV